MQQTGEVVDAAGVAVIVIGAVINTGAAAVRLAHHETGIYRRFRQEFGQIILLGLELLVAGDTIRKVAAEPSLTSVGVLGIIVLIRTFLSFSLTFNQDPLLAFRLLADNGLRALSPAISDPATAVQVLDAVVGLLAC